MTQNGWTMATPTPARASLQATVLGAGRTVNVRVVVAE